MSEERELIEKMYRKIIMSRVREPATKAPMCPSGIVMLNNTNFVSSIRECVVSVIDFYADWCIPCKIMDQY